MHHIPDSAPRLSPHVSRSSRDVRAPAVHGRVGACGAVCPGGKELGYNDNMMYIHIIMIINDGIIYIIIRYWMVV